MVSMSLQPVMAVLTVSIDRATAAGNPLVNGGTVFLPTGSSTVPVTFYYTGLEEAAIRVRLLASNVFGVHQPHCTLLTRSILLLALRLMRSERLRDGPNQASG